MSEVPLDARSTVRSISRHWRLLAVCILFGVTAGVLYAALVPRWPTARSQVILAPADAAANGQSTRDMGTEIQIATSSGVLNQAGKVVRPRLTASTLQDRVDVTAPTQDILEIRVRAATSRDAIALSNAVANSYVDYSNNASTKRAKQLLAALQSQAARLNQQAADLQTQIAQHASLAATLPRGSAAATSESVTLTSLQARYGDLVQQLDSVNTQIGNADLGGSLANNGASVLEAATTATKPSRLVAARPILLAAFVGLIIGSVLALRRERRNRRLRKRQDIANAIGAPVLASLAAERVRNIDQFLALLNHYQPDLVDSWGLRQILQEAGAATPTAPTHLTLVSHAGDRHAILAAPQLAAFSASLGRSTALVVGTRDPSTSLLRATCQAATRHKGLIQRSLLLSRSSDDPTIVGGVDLTVCLVIGDPSESMPRDSKSVTFAVVSAGFATAQQLADLANAAAAANQPVRGVIVVDPDRYDETSGRRPRESRARPTQLLAIPDRASETVR